MLALSMVVITAVIDGPGIGVNILRAMQILNVGRIFDAGLAIVILAIVLDRVTEQASRRMDARERAGDAERAQGGLVSRRLVLIGLGLVVIAAVGATAVAPDWAGEFPKDWAVLTFREPVNDIVDWIKTNLVVPDDDVQERLHGHPRGPDPGRPHELAVLARHRPGRCDRLARQRRPRHRS